MVMALVSAFQAVLPQLLPLLLHALQLPHSTVVILWQNFYLAFIIHVFSSFFLPHIVCKCMCEFLFGQVSRSVFGPAGVLAACELPNGHYIKHENCSAC